MENWKTHLQRSTNACFQGITVVRSKRKQLGICLLLVFIFCCVYFRQQSLSRSVKYCNVYRNKTVRHLLQQNDELFPSTYLKLRELFHIRLFHYGSSDRDVSLSVMMRGIWEPRLLYPLLDVLRHNPRMHFIDIGADLGVYSLPVAKLGRAVVAVEPIEESCLRLLASAIVNKVDDQIVLLRNAVDRFRRRMYIEKNNGVLGRKKLVEKNGTRFIKLYEEVNAIQMDDLLEVITFQSAILKLDIDGDEHLTIEGAHQLLTTLDIPMIIMNWSQYTLAQSRPKALYLIHYFMNLNYQPFPSVQKVSAERLDVEKPYEWPTEVVWHKRKASGTVV